MGSPHKLGRKIRAGGKKGMAKRQKAAQERSAARGARSTQEQLDLIAERPGASEKEKAKIIKEMRDASTGG